MQFNINQREIGLKVVYYGPPLSGKTTNLEAVHAHLAPAVRGRLMSLDTADDRTLFFDLLPLTFKTASGYRLKLKLFTVPGQVIHATTRKLVLQGADGLIFVADSQLSEARRKNEFWNGMRAHLADNGLEPDEIPTVIQFNKRDLPSVRTMQELEAIAAHSREPIYTAIAIRSEGVLETLYGLLALLLRYLDERYDFRHNFRLSHEEFFDHIFGSGATARLAGRQVNPPEGM